MIPHLHTLVIGTTEKKQMKEVHQDHQEDLAIRDHPLIGAESIILTLTDLTILELAQDMYTGKDVLVKLLLE
jgi:hypothetical protein